MEANPNLSSYLYAIYADFLVERGLFDEAEQFYQLSRKLTPNDSVVLNNYACFLTNIRHDYKTAEQLFDQCVHCDPDYRHMKNFYLFQKDAMKDDAKAQQLMQQLQEMESSDGEASFIPLAFVTGRRDKFEEVSKILNIEITQEVVKFTNQ
jgi:Tfp pilus assembly protein PilF